MRSGGALLDAGDGFDLVLQVLVSERDLAAAALVLWTGLVHMCLAN